VTRQESRPPGPDRAHFRDSKAADLECPLGEMKIIGPRAIVGHRRQTRTVRLPLGRRRRLPFGKQSTGDVGRPSFGSERPRRAEGRRPVLEHPRERELRSRRGLVGTGFGWHRGHDPLAILAKRKTGPETRPAGDARDVHRTSSSPWGFDDTHRRSRPRARHPPRGTGRVEHRT
jgi:hypothetical protein